MSAKHLTSSDFDASIASGYTLVDFWAEWCTPCKMIAPAIEELATELEGKVQVAKLDTDNNTDIAGRYGVMSIPTMILFKDGEVVDRLVGAVPKAVISDFVSKTVKS